MSLGDSLPISESIGVFLGVSGIAAGAIRPQSGAVRVDGVDMADWEPDLLGAFMGYLPQEIALLAGSVAENIRRFETRAEANAAQLDALVLAAAKDAGAYGLITGLPGGFDAPLGHGAKGLSAGQAQRIALARALFRQPPILILDEPNAHLDADGERALAGAIARAKARKAAILLIAHRPAALALADRLAVLQDGRLAAIGEREEILKQFSGPARSEPSELAEPRS